MKVHCRTLTDSFRPGNCFITLRMYHSVGQTTMQMCTKPVRGQICGIALSTV